MKRSQCVKHALSSPYFLGGKDALPLVDRSSHQRTLDSLCRCAPYYSCYMLVVHHWQVHKLVKTDWLRRDLQDMGTAHNPGKYHWLRYHRDHRHTPRSGRLSRERTIMFCHYLLYRFLEVKPERMAFKDITCCVVLAVNAHATLRMTIVWVIMTLTWHARVIRPTKGCGPRVPRSAHLTELACVFWWAAAVFNIGGIFYLCLRQGRSSVAKLHLDISDPWI